MFRIQFYVRQKEVMRDHMVRTLGEERAEAILESLEPFVYPVVIYDALEVILYILYTD